MSRTTSLVLAIVSVLARSHALGEPCLLGNNRLDPQTHYFHSDCSDKEYCAAPAAPSWAPASSGSALPPVSTQADDLTGLFRRQEAGATTCQPKGCRRDEDPFGYDTLLDQLPPRCAQSEFCPDEGSACQDLVGLGGPCQLARDDQCIDPPRGANSGSAICLNYACLWANGTAGVPCKVENSVYSGYGPDGSIAFSEIVTRSTCLSPSLYCSPKTLVCVPTQPIGAACAADVECDSGSCGLSGLCVPLVDLPNTVPSYAYILAALLLLALLGGTSTGLFLLHQSERREKAEAKRQMIEEQDRYRAAIAELGAAALLAGPSRHGGTAMMRGESYATSYTYGTGSTTSSGEGHTFSGRSYAYEPSISSGSDTLSELSRRRDGLQRRSSPR